MLSGRECDIESLRIRFAIADLLQNPRANWRTIAKEIIHNSRCDPFPLLGLSTKKVGEALMTILGEKGSPATVSRGAKTLDTAVLAFPKRKLSNVYRALIFDGIVLSRKTCMGALKWPVLAVLGTRHDGKKEVIDFRLAPSESASEWHALLANFQFKDLAFRKSIWTTNFIERRFKEVRRRTRPMGVISDRMSVDRILYAVFMYENKAEEVYPVFLLAHKS